eukprot:COSAG05_NODE_10324_length_571_cov_1.156780_1_plen_85_part_00
MDIATERGTDLAARNVIFARALGHGISLAVRMEAFFHHILAVWRAIGPDSDCARAFAAVLWVGLGVERAAVLFVRFDEGAHDAE